MPSTSAEGLPTAPEAWTPPGDEKQALGVLHDALVALRADLTADRWHAFGTLIAQAARAGHGRAVLAYGPNWADIRPKAAMPRMDVIGAIWPVMTATGQSVLDDPASALAGLDPAAAALLVQWAVQALADQPTPDMWSAFGRAVEMTAETGAASAPDQYATTLLTRRPPGAALPADVVDALGLRGLLTEDTVDPAVPHRFVPGTRYPAGMHTWMFEDRASITLSKHREGDDDESRARPIARVDVRSNPTAVDDAERICAAFDAAATSDSAETQAASSPAPHRLVPGTRYPDGALTWHYWEPGSMRVLRHGPRTHCVATIETLDPSERDGSGIIARDEARAELICAALMHS